MQLVQFERIKDELGEGQLVTMSAGNYGRFVPFPTFEGHLFPTFEGHTFEGHTQQQPNLWDSLPQCFSPAQHLLPEKHC